MIDSLNVAAVIAAGSGRARAVVLRALRAASHAFAFVACGLLLVLPGRVQAAGLDCPEMGPLVPDLIAGAQQIQRMTTGNDVDLANEVQGLINRIQTEKPGVSNDDIINGLIAAYCPVVAGMTQLSSAEKFQLIRRFDAVVMRELTAMAMPSGSLIIANVPLPPPVFRSLTSQADAAGQTPAQFMATILTAAAKR
jgi:hypothetical protein